MKDVAYHRPHTLGEAMRLFAEIPGARYLAGGTDVLVRLREGRSSPAALISLRGIADLGRIEVDGALRIGAAVPVAEVAAHPAVRERWPALAAGARAIGSPQIRNAATVGGNLCNASPCADMGPPLLVHDARVEIVGPGGRRTLVLDEFLVAKGRTRLEPGEIVAALVVDPPVADARATFLKKGRVAMDIAIASVAVLVEVVAGRVARVRLGAGSVAPRPLRLRAAEAALEGRHVDAEAIAAARAAAMAEIAPISDLRASSDYRRALLGALLNRALAATLAVAPASGGAA